MAEWVKVAEVTELAPDSMKPVQIGEQHIAVVHAGGQFYAIGGICTHAHCYLAYGWVEGEIVICACHGAEFDVKTGKPLDLLGSRPAGTFEVRVEGNDILVAC